MSATLREQIDTYIKRVKDLSDHVKGNEQATKQSLIGPFFTMLGYDLTDPRECIPEYRADFGKERSSKPIDWAFLNGAAFAFFVEAKEVGKKLSGFDEQLADYFAKETSVKLGILTNGAQWRFFTDVVNPNVMDKEPFASWDIMADEAPPVDVITLLQKSQFNPELIRAYAQRKRAQNLLVGELSRLLEPAPEFTKLAVANLETRNLTQAVTESWKPVVAAALNEWARQRMLASVLAAPPTAQQDSRADKGEKGEVKVETTAEELAAFELIKRMLGPDNPIAYEDSVAYFKVHLAERRTWVFTRLQFGKKQTSVWFPLPIERVTALAGDKPVSVQSGWSVVTLEANAPLDDLEKLFKASYQHVSAHQTLEGRRGCERIVDRSQVFNAQDPPRSPRGDVPEYANGGAVGHDCSSSLGLLLHRSRRDEASARGPPPGEPRISRGEHLSDRRRLDMLSARGAGRGPHPTIARRPERRAGGSRRSLPDRVL